MTRISPARIAFVAVLALVVLFAAAPAFAAAPNPTVSGTLYGSDGAPITDGQVVVSHQVRGVWKPMLTLSTAPSGSWTFTTKPDTFQLAFSAPNADPETRVITTAKGVNQTVDVTLVAYGWLGGSVTDQVSGATLSGASVELYLRNADGTWPSTPLARTTTDGSGAYSFGRIACGTYAVKASATGYSDGYYGGGTSVESAGTIPLARGATVSAGVALAPIPTGPSTISGNVSQGITPTPVANAWVLVFKQNADGSWPTSFSPGNEFDMVVTNYLGNYITEIPLPIGNYKVRFFSVHGTFAAEWYDHVSTISEATTLTISSPGQSYTGIDAWVNRTK